MMQPGMLTFRSVLECSFDFRLAINVISFSWPLAICYEIANLLLLTGATVLAIRNAIQTEKTIRLFWSFLGSSFALWATVPLAHLRYMAVNSDLTSSLLSATPAFLHIVMLIAAVAARPHFKLPAENPYRTTLNLLILVLFLVFAYAYLVFPYPTRAGTSSFILRFEMLYLFENLILLYLLGWLAFHSPPPWKVLYRHMFGACAVYAVGSSIANFAEALNPESFSRLIKTPLAAAICVTAAICWFVWINALGHGMVEQLDQTLELQLRNGWQTSLAATMVLLAIAVTGAFALFSNQPPNIQRIRVAFVLAAVIVLASLAFIRDTLLNKELASKVLLADERLQFALESGRMYAFEADISTGSIVRSTECLRVLTWLGDPRTDTYPEMLARIDPRDRESLVSAIARLTLASPGYKVCYRVPRLEGIGWFEESGHAFFDAHGKILRIVGLVVDVTERMTAERALYETEKLFRLVANSAPVLIWMSGPDKLVTFLNQAWLNFTGRPIEEELGNSWATGVHPDDLERWFKTYSNSFDARMPFEIEYRLLRFDGEYRWVVDRGVPRSDADGTFVGYIGSAIDITDRKVAEEALFQMTGRLIQVHEDERSRIARELHDDLSQRMALLQVGLDHLQETPELPAESFRQIKDIVETASEISSDLHNLSHQLHPSKLDTLGLTGAARSFCKDFSKQHNLQIDFVEHDVPRQLPKEVTLSLFRVLQESLRNVVKHSGATEVHIALSGNDKGIELSISDSGVGFDPQSIQGKAGIGLISMRERLRLIGGHLSVDSKVSSGTRVRVFAPLAAGIERPEDGRKTKRATQ